MHAIYGRITDAGPKIVGVRLTAAAYAHGLALGLPEKVEMARPTRVRHAILIDRLTLRSKRHQDRGTDSPITPCLERAVTSRLLRRLSSLRQSMQWRCTGERRSTT